MNAMRKTIITILALLILSVQPLYTQEASTQKNDSQDTTAPETAQENPGFGLQANIFRQVRNLNTDFTQNFSIMSEYNLTPGDVFTLTVSTGIKSDGSISNSQEYTMQLQDNYNLNIPFLGNINVKDRTLPGLQDYIIRRIKNLMPVQYVNFRLASPAQFNIFIYGGVNAPGYIVANPLMGVIEAIAVAGGFKPGASYRNIQLVREENGEEVRETVDISRFYAYADFNANPGLQPGDKIYVPQADIVSNITGEVKYPGHYELQPDENLKTLINLAGGMTPDAVTSSVDVVSLDERGVRHTVNVTKEEFDTYDVKNGDVVTVHSIAENVEMITIEGAIFGSRYVGDSPVKVPTQPVRVDIPYYPGITVLDVLDLTGGPTPFLNEKENSYIEKAESGDRKNINVKDLWKSRDKRLNLTLDPGDLVYVAMKKLQVFVTGEVSDPGAYNYQNGMKVTDYILRAGGIKEDTGNPDELYFVDEVGNRTRVGLREPVEPGSHIYVSRRQMVFVTGQVNTPGSFPYRPELTVSDYILYAGGIVDNIGDPNGIFFVDEKGKKTKVNLTDPVDPGTNIYVAKNLLFKSDQFVKNFLITTGWVTAIIGVATTIIQFIQLTQDL